MTKQEHIDWWKKDALRSWDTAFYLLEGKQFVFSLYPFHLVIRKLLKAHWIKENSEGIPTRGMSLTDLYNATDLTLSNNWCDYLGAINPWFVEGRYPDLKEKVYQRANAEYMASHQSKLEALKTILLETL